MIKVIGLILAGLVYCEMIALCFVIIHVLKRDWGAHSQSSEKEKV